MERGDIYLVDLEPTIGHEQRGYRPVLVISTREFNNMTETPIVLPITKGGNFARIAGLTVSLNGCGTKTGGVVRCDQPCALDIDSRYGKFVEKTPDDIMKEVLLRVKAIFS